MALTARRAPPPLCQVLVKHVTWGAFGDCSRLEASGGSRAIGCHGPATCVRQAAPGAQTALLTRGGEESPGSAATSQHRGGRSVCRACAIPTSSSTGATVASRGPGEGPAAASGLHLIALMDLPRRAGASTSGSAAWPPRGRWFRRLLWRRVGRGLDAGGLVETVFFSGE